MLDGTFFDFDGEQVEAIEQLIADRLPEISHILLLDTTNNDARMSRGKIELSDEAIIALGWVTADELAEKGAGRGSLIAASVMQWARGVATSRTMPGEERRFMLRMVRRRGTGEGQFVASPSFRCSAEASDSPVGEPLDPDAAASSAEARSWTGIRELASMRVDHMRELREGDAYLEGKFRRLIDYYERFESIHVSQEQRMADENRQLRANLDRVVDKMLDHRVSLIESKEKEVEARAKEAETTVKGETTEMIGELGARALDIVEQTLSLEKSGLPPELAKHLPAIMKNPKARALLAHPKLGVFLTNEETIESMAGVLNELED